MINMLDILKGFEVNKVKHAIIGAGVIGFATGVWLEANKQEVKFYDINKETVKKIQKKGYKASYKVDAMTIRKHDPAIIWICTAEWDVEKVIKNIYEYNAEKIYVVRSTMPPGETEKIAYKYGLIHVAHIPEFLRQNNAIDDIFNEDRIIIGAVDERTILFLKDIYKHETAPVIFTDMKTSALIKYASNCWLSTQISYWNEIKKICDGLEVNPQAVANAVCLDKRISKYGSAMLGKPYGGACFPKDMTALIQAFDDKKINPELLKAVKEVNETL